MENVVGTEETILVLERLREVLISEFSYDGEDPTGVKAYQEEVDKAQNLIDRLKNQQHAPVVASFGEPEGLPLIERSDPTRFEIIREGYRLAGAIPLPNSE